MSGRLFEIRIGGTPAAAAELNGNGDHQSAHLVELPFRQADERGLHRYCNGCSQETEHVLYRSTEGENIAAIRRPAAEAASGTTMCVDCGQRRSPAVRPDAPVWSFWPRTPADADGVTGVRVSRRER